VLETGSGQAYIATMDTAHHSTNDCHISPPEETEAQQRRRLVWEAEMIAEADAEIAAGLYVDGDEVDVWLASIGTDQELPTPPTRRR
jgi:predicted transcriptional regulator